MLEKGKINTGEFEIIVIIFTLGSTILVGPSLLASYVKQDAWIASFLSLMIGLCFIFLYNQLTSFYPEMTFIEMTKNILGSWIGGVVSFLFIFYFFIISAGLLREIGDFLTTQILVATPIQTILISFILISMAGVKLGIEVISRAAIIFFPWMILMLALLFLFLIPEVEISNIQPIYGEGFKAIARATYSSLGLPYLELFIFLMITPYVSNKQRLKKSFYKGTIIGGVVLSILIIFSIIVLGADFTARHAYPSYILGKKISLGTVIERLEVIVAIIWFFSMYFKLTICYYGITLGLAQIFKLKSYKILVFPLAFLLVTFSIILYPDIVYFQDFLAHTWTPYSLTICFFIPCIIVFAANVKKVKTNKESGR